MKFLGYKRYRFTGMLYLPKENTESSGGGAILEYEKDVEFDFTDDPTAPRQEFVAAEPFPTAAHITFIHDRYGVEPLPTSQWTITSVEPIMGPMGGREAYRHQAALYEPPDFGYDGIVRG